MNKPITLQERQAIRNTIRKHGEVWKMDNMWYVQFRAARHGFLRKRDAVEWSRSLLHIEEEAYVAHQAELEAQMSSYEKGLVSP